MSLIQDATYEGLFKQGLGRVYKSKQAFIDDFDKIVTDEEFDGDDLEEDECIFVSFEMLKETLKTSLQSKSPSIIEAITSPFMGSYCKTSDKKVIYKICKVDDMELVKEVPSSTLLPPVHGNVKDGKKRREVSAKREEIEDEDEDEVDGLIFPPTQRRYSIEQIRLPMKRGTDIVDDDRSIHSPDAVNRIRSKRAKLPNSRCKDDDEDDEDDEDKRVADIFDLIDNWDEWSQRTYPNNLLKDCLLKTGWDVKSVKLSSVSVGGTEIFLPPWSQDFDLREIETSMEKNRDYFVDIDDVRSYIARKCSRRKGINRCRSAATPEDGVRNRVKLAEQAKKDAAVRAEQERVEKKRKDEQRKEERKRLLAIKNAELEERRRKEEEEERLEALKRKERAEAKRQQAEERAAREEERAAREEAVRKAAEEEARAHEETWATAFNIPEENSKEIVLHCVKYWDILSTKHYVFNLIWPELKKINWTEEETCSRNLMLSKVYVPNWAQDKFGRAGKDPDSLIQNRDFFVEKDDVREYITKYGIASTRSPPSPNPLEGRRRRSLKSAPPQPPAMPCKVVSKDKPSRVKTEYGGEDSDDGEEEKTLKNTVHDLVRNWDSYALEMYPWTSLWMGLQALKWQQLAVCKGYEMRCSHVYVPPWATVKFLEMGSDPSALKENRDYFIDHAGIRPYIAKYGLKPTNAPPTIHKRGRKPVQRLNISKDKPSRVKAQDGDEEDNEDNNNEEQNNKKTLEEIQDEFRARRKKVDMIHVDPASSSSSSSSSSTPPVQPPKTVTKEKLNTTPADSADAAVYIVEKWEIYQKTTYPWPILWSHLKNCGWREIPVARSRLGDDSTVFVPSWVSI